ncbi:MAG: response regulator transcription factor [bacterium]|nr:response regulator transcription factor [bacterium]
MDANTSPKTVSLVEDEPLVRQRLQRLIDDSPDFSLLRSYSSGVPAVQDLPIVPPDLLITDLGLPGMRGEEVIARVKETLPELPIVAYTVFEDEDSILGAIRAGANGYILKDTAEQLILAELRVVLLGGSTLTPRIAERILNLQAAADSAETQGREELTPRELEILNEISLGFTYGEIAEHLTISLHTVRRHIEKIYRKLNVNSRHEATAQAQKLRLL